MVTTQDERVSSQTGIRQRRPIQNPSSMHNYRPARKSLDATSMDEDHVQFNEKNPLSTHNASYVSSLVGGMRPTEETKLHSEAITTIDTHFRYFTVWLIVTWFCLVVIMYAIVPEENIMSLSGLEQRAAFTSMSLIFISFLIRIIQLLGVGKRIMIPSAVKCPEDGDLINHRGKPSLKALWKSAMTRTSGLLLGGLAIQVVAFMTDFLMAFFPVPVMIDPVLGTRVHVLRWCEWFPCTAFMTYMMEGADLFWPYDFDAAQIRDGNEKSGEKIPKDFFKNKFMHACRQGFAVFLGLMFPFCPGFKTWICALFTSVSMYFTNYPRLIKRRSEVPKSLHVGASIEEAERYNSTISALRLRYICLGVWSIIVALYFISSIGPMLAPKDSILHNPAANMVCECFFDVISKVLFLVTIMDVHQAIFDPVARSERRIEELRKLMAAVWESSSDPIAISVKNGSNGGITTLLSPAFFALGGGRGALRRLSKDEIKDLFSNRSVLFKLSQDVLMRSSNGDNESYEVRFEDILSVNYTDFSTGLGQTSGIVFGGQLVAPELGCLRAVAESVVRAWQNKGQELVFSHELSWTCENKKNRLVYSEAKVSQLDENSLIVIIRDISERIKVFETEKKILFEATSRQKDAEANRFTRHEVKNGLLAAIGLYETLCEAQRSHLFKERIDDSDFGIGESDESAYVVRCMNELGKSLHETLDTIMLEAMTRDLIHDVYRPHRERVDVATAISGTADCYTSFGNVGHNLRRFPLITKPSPLPKFYLDPKLLRYFHRQVLSNACKYGKTGGDVLTEIIYDETSQKLKINVINLPGKFHDKLVEMGSSAENAVFRKGSQIHESIIVDTSSTVASSVKKAELAAHPGDGGW